MFTPYQKQGENQNTVITCSGFFMGSVTVVSLLVAASGAIMTGVGIYETCFNDTSTGVELLLSGGFFTFSGSVASIYAGKNMNNYGQELNENNNLLNNV